MCVREFVSVDVSVPCDVCAWVCLSVWVQGCVRKYGCPLFLKLIVCSYNHPTIPTFEPFTWARPRAKLWGDRGQQPGLGPQGEAPLVGEGRSTDWIPP